VVPRSGHRLACDLGNEGDLICESFGFPQITRIFTDEIRNNPRKGSPTTNCTNDTNESSLQVIDGRLFVVTFCYRAAVEITSPNG